MKYNMFEWTLSLVETTRWLTRWRLRLFEFDFAALSPASIKDQVANAFSCLAAIFEVHEPTKYDLQVATIKQLLEDRYSKLFKTYTTILTDQPDRPAVAQR